RLGGAHGPASEPSLRGRADGRADVHRGRIAPARGRDRRGSRAGPAGEPDGSGDFAADGVSGFLITMSGGTDVDSGPGLAPFLPRARHARSLPLCPAARVV